MKHNESDYEVESTVRVAEDSHEMWPGYVPWDTNPLYTALGDIVWCCEVMYAGKLYTRNLFGNQEDAQRFAARMREREPDLTSIVQSLPESSIWN